jgi:membrane protein
VLWAAGAIAIPALLTFAVFLLLYWLLPSGRASIWHLVPGAALGALGFELVKQGFAIYVANFTNYDVVYGSLASLMALLFWIFISANVFLFGAEVASETSHVLLAEPRHGHREATSEGPEPGWRAAVWAFIRGLVLAPPEDIGRPQRESERPTAGDE